MISSQTEWAKFGQRVLAAWILEWSRPLPQLREDLTAAWAPVFGIGIFGLAFGLVTGSLVRTMLHAVFRTVDAFQEYAQDLSLVGHRAIARVIETDLPVPPELAHRVMTGAQAVRLVTSSFLEAGISVLDGDLPAEFQAFEIGKKIRGATDFLQSPSHAQFGAFLKSAVPAGAILNAGRMLQMIIGYAFALAAIVMIWRIWSAAGQEHFRRRMLSQDSKRITAPRRKRRHRENERPGPDSS